MSLELKKRGRIWYVRGTVRGLSCFETTGTANEGLAEQFRAKREAELYEEALYGKRAVVSFQRAALSYLEDGDKPRSNRTKGFVAGLVKHFGTRALATIDQDAADAAVRVIVGTDVAPATKNRAVLAPLIAILNHAADRKWCDSPRIKRKEEPRQRTVWIAPAQARALLGASAPHLAPLLTFMLCTGARVSEALDLLWNDVDLPGSMVILRDTKNGTDRKARLSPAAISAIANMPHRGGQVFRRDDGEPYEDRKRESGGQIKTAFTNACKRAGMASKIVGPDGKPLRFGKRRVVRWKADITPHDLRHTWATWFYAVSKDQLLLRDEGGWRVTAMTERYTHLMNDPAVIADIHTVWGASHPRIGLLPTKSEHPKTATGNVA